MCQLDVSFACIISHAAELAVLQAQASFAVSLILVLNAINPRLSVSNSVQSSLLQSCDLSKNHSTYD
jgi:hypothetical protein